MAGRLAEPPDSFSDCHKPGRYACWMCRQLAAACGTRAPGAPLALLCGVAPPTRAFNCAPAATAALWLLALMGLMLAGVYLDTNAM